MNVIGTVLEKTEQNEMFVKFKSQLKENLSKDEEDYEWKVFMLKKYFKDNINVNIVRIVIGIVLLILSTTSKIFKILGNGSFSTILVLGCLIGGVGLTGSGIMFLFSNYRFLKNYKDYLWDEEGEIAEKIIRFYDKAH